MTKQRKAASSATVRRPGPGRFRRSSRALLLVGVLLLGLTVLGRGVRAMQAQPDWWDEISPTGSVTMTGSGVSRSEADEYLEGLGLVPGAVADPELRIHASDGFHGVQEARAEWAVHRLELNGEFALRQSTEVLGQAMTVTSVISSGGVLTTDDRGGSRVEAYRRFPTATCARGPEGTGCDVAWFDVARDNHGSITEFVRDDLGLPVAVRFGDSLVLRYKFTPPLPARPSRVRPGDRWREPSSWDLIDVRTSEIVFDSVDAAKVASGRPVLSVSFPGIGRVLRFEDGLPFAVAPGKSGLYALLPLEKTSDLWRIVHANGDMSQRYRFRVDYTDDLVRVEIRTGEYGERSIVVEAPRRRESRASVSIVHPAPDLLTDAMRSGVRLRTSEPLDPWLHSTFEKESLPIVLWPFHSRGIRVDSGVAREFAANSVEHHPQFGPGDGCERNEVGIVCTGGASKVIGEEGLYLDSRIFRRELR